MLISVIIPVYNAAQFIEDSIESILNQSYKTLEIICVDDCSTDNSYDLLSKYAEIDSRVVLLQNELNSGISSALNRGISIAKGELIARMDADDISLHHRIEYQYKFLKNNDLDFVGSPVIYIDEKGIEIGQSEYYGTDEVKSFLKYKSTIGHPTWMLYKSTYLKLNCYRNLAPAEDYDFLFRAANCGFKIGMTKTPLLKFRTRMYEGGTALSQGLVQRKMFNYVRKINTKHLAVDWKYVETIKNPNVIQDKLFYISQILYTLAMRKRHAGNIFMSSILIVLSAIISIYQAQLIIRVLYLKSKINFANRSIHIHGKS